MTVISIIDNASGSVIKMANDSGAVGFGVAQVVAPPLITWNAIVAVDADGGYAKNGVIPWHYPEDLKWFKAATDGSACVMGKNTYLDLCKRLGDKAFPSVLPNRQCFVISSTLEPVENAAVIRSLDEVAVKLDVTEPTKVFIIGGGELYRKTLGLVDHVYVTIINKTHDCDQFFPVDSLPKMFYCSKTYKGKVPELVYTIWSRHPT